MFTANRIIVGTIIVSVLFFVSNSVLATDYRQYLDKANKNITEQKYDDAVKNLRKAIKSNDRCKECYRAMALCFEKIGMLDSAVFYYEGAIVLNPRDIDSYQKIGDIYYYQKDYHEAMSWYERGIDLGRLNPASYYKLGQINLRWRELQRAYDYFEKSVEIDSSYSAGYFGIGLTYLKAGDSLKAADSFKKSIKLGSQPKAAYYLGLISFNQGQPDSAKIWLNDYLQQEPAGEFSPDAEKLLNKIKESKK